MCGMRIRCAHEWFMFHNVNVRTLLLLLLFGANFTKAVITVALSLIITGKKIFNKTIGLNHTQIDTMTNNKPRAANQSIRGGRNGN